MSDAIKLNQLFSSEKERKKHMYVIAFEDAFTAAWVAGSQEGAYSFFVSRRNRCGYIQSSLKQQNMWLWLMDLVVFPSQALAIRLASENYRKPVHIIYLSDAQRPPFFFPKQLQCALRAIKIIMRNLLEHILRKLDMSVFEVVIGIPAAAGLVYFPRIDEIAGIPRRIVDRINEFFQFFAFRLQQKTRVLVSSA